MTSTSDAMRIHVATAQLRAKWAAYAAVVASTVGALGACQPTLPTSTTAAVALGPSLQVDIHWDRSQPTTPATAELTLVQTVRMADHQMVLRDQDYLAVGTLIDAVPIVATIDGTRLRCTRDAAQAFANDTTTFELRLPLAARAAIHCAWPGPPGLQRVIVRARVSVTLRASYLLELREAILHIRTRLVMPTQAVRHGAQSQVGDVTIWNWVKGQRVGPALARHTLPLHGGTAVLDHHDKIMVQRHNVVRDDGDEGQSQSLLVTEEIEAVDQPFPMVAGHAVMWRRPEGDVAVSPSNLRRNGIVLAALTDIVAYHRSKEFGVRDGNAQSHKIVIRNFRNAPVTVDCWEPSPLFARPLGFWRGPSNSAHGRTFDNHDSTRRSGWLVTPLMVAAKSETWLARSWRTP